MHIKLRRCQPVYVEILFYQYYPILILRTAFPTQIEMKKTDDDILKQAKGKVSELLEDLHKKSQEAASSGLIDKEKYVVPPHLHDLQENDLPETQRGLVMTEIAQFRERAAKREREKMRDVQQAMPVLTSSKRPPLKED